MNKKIWYKFINGEIAINFETEEEVHKFFQIKKVRNIGYSMDLTKYNWDTFKNNTCFYIASTFSERRLNFCHKSMFFKVYTYKELMEDDDFRIKKDSMYKITYKSINDASDRRELRSCTLKKLKGSIANFSTDQVVIDTEDGMQILSFKQIVEMVVIN